jgi:hypothetical protein
LKFCGNEEGWHFFINLSFSQVCVREALYKRLPSVLIADPTSAEDVFDLLWPHFQQFYEEREVNPYFAIAQSGS